MVESEQSLPILTDDICLMPGDPTVRIEEAPSNARRIFTGIDINCNINRVWNALTEYENLQLIIPSLVKNEVLFRTERGARLSQVGGAKVRPLICSPFSSFFRYSSLSLSHIPSVSSVLPYTLPLLFSYSLSSIVPFSISFFRCCLLAGLLT